jgi:hypothetical protein
MSRVRRIIVAALLSGSLLGAIVGGVVTHAFADASPNASCVGKAASTGQDISSYAQDNPSGPGNAVSAYASTDCTLTPTVAVTPP